MENIRSELRRFAKPEKAKVLAGFFKTGKGDYSEGDVFLGVMVPQTRLVAKKFFDVGFEDLVSLLKSKVHEERLRKRYLNSPPSHKVSVG